MTDAASDEEDRKGSFPWVPLGVGATCVLALLGVYQIAKSTLNEPRVMFEVRASTFTLPHASIEQLGECLDIESPDVGALPRQCLQIIPDTYATVDFWNTGGRPATDLNLAVRATGPILQHEVVSTEPSVDDRLVSVGESRAGIGSSFIEATGAHEIRVLDVPRLAPDGRITIEMWWRGTGFHAYLDQQIRESVQGSHADGSVIPKTSGKDPAVPWWMQLSLGLAMLLSVMIALAIGFEFFLKLRNRYQRNGQNIVG